MDSRKKQSAENSLQSSAEIRPSAVGGSVPELLRTFWSQMSKTTVFLLAVVAVIVAGSIAWFISNNKVQSGTVPISSGFEAVRLATIGRRQTAEEQYLKLNVGSQITYDGKDYYCTEGDTIALRLSEDYIVSPGASGSVTFYIIPNRDGAATVNLYLGLTGYAMNKDKNGVEPVDDSVLNALLSGHILLFSKYADSHYSDWLFSPSGSGILDNVITVTLPAETKKDVPFPVTLYWIWPLRYENMAEDLYSEGSKEYAAKFVPFIEQQAVTSNMTFINGTSYRYSRIFLTQEEKLETKVARSKAYNLADEYIGTNADYLYLTIQTSATYDGIGKEQS